MKFAYDGTTSDGPSGQRSSSQTSGDGSRWPPVLISWVTSNEDPDFADDEVLGEVGSQSVRVPNGPSVFVTDFGAGDLTGLAALGKRACSSDG